MHVLSHTESVCPECLARIPAKRVQQGNDVYMHKTCAEHGDFSTILWRGNEPAFGSWVKPKTPSFPKNPFTTVQKGCPFDCGICPEHQQQSCCVLLEVTQRCDLHCPVCFADAARQSAGIDTPDMTLTEIETWYERLLSAGGPFNIQLSGGEPCVRNDLPEIIRLGRKHGFSFFQLNTNGLRIARDPEYLEQLKEAGLSTVFLQFDGTNDEIYKKIRGRAILDKKLAVIEHCQRLEIGVVLVPTLVPGVNTSDIGNILLLALEHMPTVRGVHFQPISYFGRYPQAPRNEDRITIPEVIQAASRQTSLRILPEHFVPPGGENALCSFHANYVLMPDNTLKALTRHKPPAQISNQALSLDVLINQLPQSNSGGCCGPAPVEKPVQAALGAARSREFVAEHWSAPSSKVDISSGPSLGEWDVFLERKRTHTFCISGMAFQDAWNLDLDRLRDCYIHTASPDGRLVPFCAFNLTDRQGNSIYRNKYETHPA
ncbi:MAG: radical SAM (seleno)protein TrsS [Chloroflexota bacterium]